VSRHRPHHVTIKMARGTWNLRSQRWFAPIRKALAVAAERRGFRIAHFSVQHDHVHMIVEANDRRGMSEGLRTLLVRVARGINAVMGAVLWSVDYAVMETYGAVARMGGSSSVGRRYRRSVSSGGRSIRARRDVIQHLVRDRDAAAHERLVDSAHPDADYWMTVPSGMRISALVGGTVTVMLPPMGFTLWPPLGTS
jgi:REP element-mobilizing transposase RayT